MHSTSINYNRTASIRVLEKRVLIPHRANHAPLCGFVTYIDPVKPVLLRRVGWEIGNDIHDAFSDTISHDNGKTWSEPRHSLGATPAKGGYSENAVLYHPERRLLIHFTNDRFVRSRRIAQVSDRPAWQHPPR